MNYLIVGGIIIAVIFFNIKLDGQDQNDNNVPDNNNEREEDPVTDPPDTFDNPSFEYFQSRTELTDFLNHYQIMARTLYGEGRSLDNYELEKIAMVIMNRVNSYKYPDNITDVCLDRWQFSCWNGLINGITDYSSNQAKVLKAELNDQDYYRCLDIAKKIINCYPECADIEALNYILNTDDVIIMNDRVEYSYADWSEGMNVEYKAKEHIFLKEA